MEMANIRSRKKKKRVIRKLFFLTYNIIIPIFLPIIVGSILIRKVSKKYILTWIGVIPGISDEWIKIAENRNFSWLYLLFVIISMYILFGVIIHKILKKQDLLPENKYFLVPSWMIRIAAIVSHLHSGNAASIPIWQFIEYLCNESSFGWRHLVLEVPKVSPADKEIKIKQTFHRGSVPKGLSRSIIVGDTYPIDVNELPNFVVAHDYVLFQSLKRNQATRMRGYNELLVLKIVEQIRKAETEGVKEIYLLLNTNPTHVQEIVREAFSDAGRNSIEHLYVYESQAVKPFAFTNIHCIY